jgi:AcrR family transcriptional regulator
VSVPQAQDAGPPRPRPRAPGERARAEVLELAARIASVEGLEGLSIGRLSTAMAKPKSSIYVLFGSKEELQLATVEAARASFISEVVEPAFTLRSGRERLLALCENFLSYVGRRVFPGGCFFVATSAELGARSGRVHDRIAELHREWVDLLRSQADRARSRGEIPGDVDPDQVAFELGTILAGADIVAILHADDSAIERARTAVRNRLHVS